MHPIAIMRNGHGGILMHRIVAAALGVTLLLASTAIVDRALPPNNNYSYDEDHTFPEPILDHDKMVQAKPRSRGRRNRKRRLGITASGCPERPPPSRPALPVLQQSTYAVSFPGSGDRMITKYLVESMTGLHVGEASTSPSSAEMNAIGNGKNIVAEIMADERDLEEGLSMLGRGQGEVVAVRTQFPHSSGKLASWDEDIPRAFVIMRNPLHAIPSYFNQLYEMRNHLPTGSATHPEHASESRDAWLKYRDKEVKNQIMAYRRFVSVWMEKYMVDEGSRLYFTYEDLVSESTGPKEAVRLANFLHAGIKAGAEKWVTNIIDTKNVPPEMAPFFKRGMSEEEMTEKATGEATQTMSNLEDIPCVWKEVVQSTMSSDQRRLEQTIENLPTRTHLRRLQEAIEFEGGNWNPEERPFTTENLAEMSGMLLELMNRWSRHQRLLKIASVYNREVSRAYLASTGQLDAAIKARDEFDKTTKSVLGNSPDAAASGSEENVGTDEGSTIDENSRNTERFQVNGRSFHIFQASPPGTGSTVVLNWLMGLFQPNRNYSFMINDLEQTVRNSGKDVHIDETVVTKTHNTRLDMIYEKFGPEFDDIFFVVSNRGTEPSTRVNPWLCQNDHVLCLEFEELIFTNEAEIEDVVIKLTNKFRARFQYFFGEDSDFLGEDKVASAVKRLGEMMEVTESLKNEPFEVHNKMFGIHGGHRNHEGRP